MDFINFSTLKTLTQMIQSLHTQLVFEESSRGNVSQLEIVQQADKEAEK